MLNHMIGIYLTFEETAKHFASMVVPFYIPTSNGWVWAHTELSTTEGPKQDEPKQTYTKTYYNKNGKN